MLDGSLGGRLAGFDSQGERSFADGIEGEHVDVVAEAGLQVAQTVEPDVTEFRVDTRVEGGKCRCNSRGVRASECSRVEQSCDVALVCPPSDCRIHERPGGRHVSGDSVDLGEAVGREGKRPCVEGHPIGSRCDNGGESRPRGNDAGAGAVNKDGEKLIKTCAKPCSARAQIQHKGSTVDRHHTASDLILVLG
jgi:hypothetical protein